MASIGTGSTPLTGCKEYYVNGNIPWINSSSTKDAIIKNPSNYITSKAILETNCVVYPKGTLIIAMYGEGKTRGQISELGIDAATNQACAAVCPLRKELKNYTKLFFESNYLHIRALAEGGTQPNLNLGKISNYEIPLPPLSEQNRICSEVSSWFSLIDTIGNSKEQLLIAIGQAKSKILDLAIHGKLVPQDPSDEPAAELLKRISPKAEITCDNPQYGKLPDTWVWTKVKDVFSINPKNKAEATQIAGFVPMTNICEGFTNQFTYETKEWGKIKSGFTHFADGDIAVAKISPCLENRKSVVLRNLPNGIGAGTTELHVFRSLGIDTLYGLYFFKSNYFISNCVGTFNGVVGQQRVGKSIVEEICFPLPPLSEQHRIVAKIEELFAQLYKIEASL